MAIDPTQLDKLRKLIGDAFAFRQLDLILRKCFGGDARINDVVARERPSREVAEKCLELTEHEGRTEVFLYLLLSEPDCPVELRSYAIVIFPELVSYDLPFADIVTSAAGSLDRHAVQIAAKVSGTLLDRLTDLIRELNVYKKLHEAIHQLKINARPQVPSVDTAVAQQDFRRAVRQYAALVRLLQINAADALTELPAMSPRRAIEQPWITTVRGCADKIQGALDPFDIALAELAVDVTARTIDPLPDQINKHIFAIVEELPLGGLLDALRTADGAGVQPEQVRQAINAIASLRVAVLTRVLDHTRWQELDNGLFVLDQTLTLPASAAFRKFTRQWSPTRKQLKLLTEGKAERDWAVSLNNYATNVDGALAQTEKAFASPTAAIAENVFENTMFDSYDTLRQAARERFYLVDKALRQNCLELSRILLPLETIKRMPSQGGNAETAP